MLTNHCQYADYFSMKKNSGKLCSKREGLERFIHGNDKQTQSNNFIVVSNLRGE